MAQKTVVKFNADVYPHVKNDITALTADELKAVDEEAKKRDIENAYEKVSAKSAGAKKTVQDEVKADEDQSKDTETANGTDTEASDEVKA